MRGYNIDITYVVDVTQRTSPYLDAVKNFVRTVGDKIVNGLVCAEKQLEQFRTRIITFSDYSADGENTVRGSEFFTIPQDRAAFDSAVDGIECSRQIVKGRVSNSLEALLTAMESDWVQLERGSLGRHIIVLVSFNYPLRLLERKDCKGYAADEFPPTAAELQDVWDSDYPEFKLSSKHKRLVLIAPDGDDGQGHSWYDVMGWQYTTFIDIENGNPDYLTDIVLSEILRS